MLAPQPNASTTQYEQTEQLTSDEAQRDTFFRDFLEYQKQEASKLPEGLSQKEALFAEFQAHLNRLSPARSGQLGGPKFNGSPAQLENQRGAIRR